MKRLFKSVVTIFLSILMAGFSLTCFRRCEKKDVDNSASSSVDTPSSESPPVIETPPIAGDCPDACIEHTVTYKMVKGGKIGEIPEFLFYENGSYPEAYYCRSAIAVSPLKGMMNYTEVDWGDGWEGTMVGSGGFVDPENANKEWEFWGWFSDETCTVPLSESDGFIGDVTIYAKISVASWTNFY